MAVADDTSRVAGAGCSAVHASTLGQLGIRATAAHIHSGAGKGLQRASAWHRLAFHTTHLTTCHLNTSRVGGVGEGSATLELPNCPAVRERVLAPDSKEQHHPWGAGCAGLCCNLLT